LLLSLCLFKAYTIASDFQVQRTEFRKK